VHPVIVAARSNLLTVPGILMLAVVLLWPASSPLWLFTGVVSYLGANVGTIPLNREVCPRISLRELSRLIVIGVLLQSLIWLVFLGATVFMPDEFDGRALAISAMVAALLVILSRGGSVWIGRKLGLFLPAPERLRKIAADTSIKTNVLFHDVLLIRSPQAQAVALHTTRHLLFTERLLQVLSDEEVASVCAHELAHLTESKAARYSRSIRMLTFLPWMFFNPLTHSFGMAGVFGLCGVTFVIPRLYGKISRKLESRADQVAKANEGDPGTYARALARLYEDNLTPAVMAKERATHPNLYDRMLAAGVTPDFPRPAAAISMVWHGQLFAVLTGMLLGLFAVRHVIIMEGGGHGFGL